MTTTLRDKLASLVRTGVPYLIGLGLAFLARWKGWVLDEESSADLMAGAAYIAGSAYYALVRWAESKWPRLGVLLGWKVQPTYDKPAQ
jgi:hypothetical protein